MSYQPSCNPRKEADHYGHVFTSKAHEHPYMSDNLKYHDIYINRNAPHNDFASWSLNMNSIIGLVGNVGSWCTEVMDCPSILNGKTNQHGLMQLPAHINHQINLAEKGQYTPSLHAINNICFIEVFWLIDQLTAYDEYLPHHDVGHHAWTTHDRGVLGRDGYVQASPSPPPRNSVTAKRNTPGCVLTPNLRSRIIVPPIRKHINKHKVPPPPPPQPRGKARTIRTLKPTMSKATAPPPKPTIPKPLWQRPSILPLHLNGCSSFMKPPPPPFN